MSNTLRLTSKRAFSNKVKYSQSKRILDQSNRNLCGISTRNQNDGTSLSSVPTNAVARRDFTSSRIFLATSTSILTHQQTTWSGAISFTCPESDVTSAAPLRSITSSLFDAKQVCEKWTNSLSFASPESDFIGAEELPIYHVKEEYIDHLQRNENLRSNMAYSMSFATTESDFSNPEFLSLLNDRMKEQLDNVSKTNYRNKVDHAGDTFEETIVPESSSTHLSRDLGTSFVSDLNSTVNIGTTSSFPDKWKSMSIGEDIPQSIQEAFTSNDSRAIVVTDANIPFRIVHVNDSWEKLCGYSLEECKGSTLECIQGPETDKSAITALMSQLMNGEEAGTVLTNYNKEGKRFHNRLKVGPLRNDSGDITHFVGVLREVYGNDHGEYLIEHGI